MNRSQEIIDELNKVRGKWQWANPEVSDICEKAAIHIRHLEQRIADRDAWLKDYMNLERELYKGSG